MAHTLPTLFTFLLNFILLGRFERIEQDEMSHHGRITNTDAPSLHGMDSPLTFYIDQERRILMMDVHAELDRTREIHDFKFQVVRRVSEFFVQMTAAHSNWLQEVRHRRTVCIN